MTVQSPALNEGGTMPARFTCDGAGESPPLRWDSGGPAAAYALVVDDPDASGGTFVHWVVVDIAGSVRSVATAAVPSGGVEIGNSSGKAAYAPACPPSGTHRYRFTVYALSRPTGVTSGSSLTTAFDAIEKQATAEGTLTVTYAHH